MQVLFIGDIVGEPGRRAVRSVLPRLRRELDLQFVVANGENSAGGNGITPAIAQELFNYGVDVITTGDHVWDQREVLGLLDREPRVLRPLNYPPGAPGHGSVLCQKESLPPVAVVNLQGRTFMPPLENPFVAARAEVDLRGGVSSAAAPGPLRKIVRARPGVEGAGDGRGSGLRGATTSRASASAPSSPAAPGSGCGGLMLGSASGGSSS